MNRKWIAFFLSIVTIGASAAAFAGPACCATGAAKPGSDSAEAKSSAGLMLASYEKISNALASDDLEAAQSAARDSLAVSAAKGGEKACDSAKKDCSEKKECTAKGCTKSMKALIEAETIEKAREQFKLVSAQAIELAKEEEGYLVMTCPMAGENGDWVQSNPEVRNPYHGSKMLRCGKVKETSAGG